MEGVTKEKSRLASPKTTLTGSPVPLASGAIDIPPVSTAEVIRLVSAMLNIVMDRLIFFCLLLIFFNFIKKNNSISGNLFNQYVCGSCGAVGFKSG